MVTPPKGDYASVPLTAEGRRVADTWDLAKDDAAGNQCKAYGVGGIIRQPGRLHITWENDNTLKMEFDAGQQTRLLHFDKGQPPAEKTWQGYSVAEWDVPPAGGVVLPVTPSALAAVAVAGGGGGGGAGGGGCCWRRVLAAVLVAAAADEGAVDERAARRPSSEARSRSPRPTCEKGTSRKNGVPYSENAVITEYVDRLGPEPDGAIYLLVRMTVDDPKYLNQPFVTSTHFRLEADGASKWKP